jgi:hypothetical protein
MTANDLRANEGRETKALNCKPITNLKEKSELSNYCKPAAFVLHAVSGCYFRPQAIPIALINIYGLNLN